MGRKFYRARADHTSDHPAEPYFRGHGDCPLNRRLIYLSLLFVVPGVGVPAATAPAPSWAMAPPAIEPLTAAEESNPAAQEIARRFNPAMALPDRDGPWPVSVRYSWSGGADLQARTIAADGSVLGAGPARAGAELARRSWADLPDRDPVGHRIEYWIDGPGDDHVRDGQTEWRRRWRAASAADRTPTQYAHLFWLDRARGELVVQYWFFYPFNEWVNHHEGDWEHINLIVQGPSRLGRAADYRIVGCEFYFHGHRLDAERTDQVAGHPLVFVGGRGHLLWWSGTQSGGSYPLPAAYPGAGGGVGPIAVADDTRAPALVLPADRFDVVVLPEPARLDARARPELSWLKLPFFAGQPRVFGNPPFIDRFGGGKPPRQPARRADWNAIGTRPLWTGAPIVDGSEALTYAQAGGAPDGLSAVHP